MESLPLIVAAAVALVVAPGLLTALSENGRVHANYRGAELPFPGGSAIVASAALALGPLAFVAEVADADVFVEPTLRTVAVYALGVAFLGLLDDTLGGAARGWRGHGAAVLSGAISTGALKAAGSLGLALYALSGLGLSVAEYLLAVALLVLTTNLFNLLDLRPGRTGKAFVLLGAGITVATLDVQPLWALGLFAGPVVVLAFFDLRERTMLGDTGSNLIGALAGLWMVLAMGTLAQAIALAVVIGITVYGEFRSISSLIESAPLLRQLDSLGRPHHPHA